MQSGNKLYFNYKGEIDGQSVKAMFVEDGSDVQAKNGILHEIDSWLPLWGIRDSGARRMGLC